MRGTRADLYQNGLKRFRNSFLTSDFEHGADWNKTRKVSSRFVLLSDKFSAQKRRIAFSGIYAGTKRNKDGDWKAFFGVSWHKLANRRKRGNGQMGHDNLPD